MVIVFGVVIVWQYLRLSKEINLPENEIIETDETVDWKTYRNEEYGFEFKYPKNWTAIENISMGHPYFVFVTLGRQETIQQGGLFEVTIRDQTEDEYLFSLAEEDFYVISQTNSSLGGEKATIYIFGRTTGLSGVQWKVIIAQKDGLLLEFSEGATLGYEDIFNQMLSSFRFLE